MKSRFNIDLLMNLFKVLAIILLLYIIIKALTS